MCLRWRLCALLAVVFAASCGSSNSDAYLERCDRAAEPGNVVEFFPRRHQSERLAARAEALLRSDPQVKALIEAKQFTARPQTVWGVNTGDKPLGVILGMYFARKLSISAENWPITIEPGAGRDDNDTTPRLLCRISLKAEGLKRMAATVNLKSDRVEELFVPGGKAEHGDVGALPAEYQSDPGY